MRTHGENSSRLWLNLGRKRYVNRRHAGPYPISFFNWDFFRDVYPLLTFKQLYMSCEPRYRKYTICDFFPPIVTTIILIWVLLEPYFNVGKFLPSLIFLLHFFVRLQASVFHWKSSNVSNTYRLDSDFGFKRLRTWFREG